MRMKPIKRPEDVPAFTSEEEEHRFWSTHYLTEECIRAAPKPAETLVEKARRRLGDAAKHVERTGG